MGATLSARMAPLIAKQLKIDQKNVYFWTDSMNVLWWISRRCRLLKTFVANRIGKIQRESVPEQWRHVGTKENPADLATRGLSVRELKENTLWWNGPDFLALDAGHWPKTDNISAPLTATKEIHSKKSKDVESSFVTRLITVDDESRLQPTRYSSWNRLKRVTAWVCRFVDNCRRPQNDRTLSELTVDELFDSENSLIHSLQLSVFETELKALQSQKAIPTSSRLTSLQPFIDDDGILRSNSRLNNADYLSYNTKHPIILPRKEWVTKLIVRSHHNQDGHSMGTNHTLASLSEKFWIMQAREEIRDTENECNMCKRRKAKAATQLMAPLPSIRLKEPLQSFGRASVDFAGPFIAIQGRGRKRAKRYLCLFTCLLTRALHLEIAYSLDTDSFLNAFYRMASRRGLPEEMLSDNGTNFVSGERELCELVQSLDQDKIQKSAADKGIKWTFNTPLAPHFGGVHESMVKSAKRAIYAVLQNADVNDEELLTAFVGVVYLTNRQR